MPTRTVAAVLTPLGAGLTATPGRSTPAPPASTPPKSDARVVKALALYQTCDDPVLIEARREAAAYIAHLWQLPPVANPAGLWLTLLGSSGTGKTLLAKLIRNAWPERYVEPSRQVVCVRRAKFEHWPKFVSDAKSGKYNASALLEELIEPAFSVIDEIGASRDPSGYVADLLVQVATRRMGRPTVFTGNCTLESLAAIDARLSSRMIRDGNRVVLVETEDFALRGLETQNGTDN